MNFDKALRDIGLVKIRYREGSGRVPAGAIFWVNPNRAKELIENGEADAVDESEDE